MNEILILKLGILFIVNLGALGYLIFSFMKLGHSYRGALRMVWDLIIFGIAGNHEYHHIHCKVKGLHLVRRTWWLMIFLDCLAWIATGSGYGTLFIVFLLLFHGYWYWHASTSSAGDGEQILFADDHWGVIYREVHPDSGFNQKSLAELDLRKKNLLVLAIERDGQILPFPKGLEILKPGDRVLLFGEISSYKAVS